MERKDIAYKKTEFGEIPTDWNVESLEGLCIEKGLVRGPFGGALKKDSFVDTGYKVYEQKHAINKTVDIGSYYVDENKYSELKRFALNSGDFIVSCSGTIGRIYQIPDEYEEGIINQALLKITIDNEKLVDQFFYQYFEYEEFQQRITDSTQGGAMKNLVGMPIIKKTLLPVPPLPEQKKIAKILSTVDGHIDEVDGMIEDLKELKKGLMQKLLTEGIGHTEFKDSEVGRIPVEWEVKTLNVLAADYKYSIVDGPFGSNLKTVDYVEEGVLVLQSNYITGERFELRDTRFITPSKAEELERSKAKAGDILMAKIGARFGSVGIIPDDIEYAILSSNAMKIDLNEKVANNDFYLYLLKYYKAIGIIDKLASGNAQPALSLKEIKNLKVPHLEIDEQKKIATILIELDRRIDLWRLEKNDLTEFKKGLMQMLLTGKVRVMVLVTVPDTEMAVQQNTHITSLCFQCL